MPLNFNTVDENQYSDIFGFQPQTADQQNPAFSITGTVEDTDLFAESPTDEKVEPEIDPLTGLPKEEAPVDEPKKEGEGEADILGDDKPQPGRKPKYDFTDINGYFQDRIKNNKLVGLVDENDEPLELKTPEQFDMLIEENINYQVQQRKAELEENWYNSKKPAWQAVAQYAELVNEPADMIPFIQGIETIQSVSQVDESTIEGAEQIVRYYKQRSGTPNDIIDDEIESLKTADKLVSAAGKLKPAILQQETKQLQIMKQKAEAEEREYISMIQDYEKTARGVIQQPIFGAKLKPEEQTEIYKMIAVPDEEQGGYTIYNEIDNLYKTKNFEMLKKIALLLTKEETFLKYASQNLVTKTATDLQKKIRLSTSPKGSNTGLEDPNKVDAPKIKVGEGQRTFGKWRP